MTRKPRGRRDPLDREIEMAFNPGAFIPDRACFSFVSDLGEVAAKISALTKRMANRTKKPNQKMQAWIDARKRHHLSHVQVQMTRELGMNPSKLGKLDNHDQEPWKMPLRYYIEHLYLKRFGKPSPDNVTSIEERLRLEQERKEARRAAKRERADQET
jgi:hypothetical protein